MDEINRVHDKILAENKNIVAIIKNVTGKDTPSPGNRAKSGT